MRKPTLPGSLYVMGCGQVVPGDQPRSTFDPSRGQIQKAGLREGAPPSFFCGSCGRSPAPRAGLPTFKRNSSSTAHGTLRFGLPSRCGRRCAVLIDKLDIYGLPPSLWGTVHFRVLTEQALDLPPGDGGRTDSANDFGLGWFALPVREETWIWSLRRWWRGSALHDGGEDTVASHGTAAVVCPPAFRRSPDIRHDARGGETMAQGCREGCRGVTDLPEWCGRSGACAGSGNVKERDDLSTRACGRQAWRNPRVNDIALRER